MAQGLDITEVSDPCLPQRIEQEVVERLEAGTIDLPILPESAQQVLRLCNSEDAEARDLSEVIHQDQSLAANLLRVANSSAYAPRVPIVSLDQAVTRLGFQKIREITLLVTAQCRIFNVPGRESIVKQEFQHALITGLYAQEIARSRRTNVEEAFLAGLLHDSGRLVLLQLISDLEKKHKVRMAEHLVTEALDTWHCRVGAAIATHWKLAPTVADAIRYHHSSDSVSDEGDSARQIALADLLGHECLGTHPERESHWHEISAKLNLYPDDLAALKNLGPSLKATIESLS